MDSEEMNTIKRILVAIDGSESADKALDFALNLAESCKAKIEIISVVPPIKSVVPRFTPAAPPTEFYGFFIEYVENRLKTVLSEALEKAKREYAHLKTSNKLLKGNPAQEIVRTAKNENFDLIVVGSRGLSGVEELFLGSVSDRVADTASCPILIVK